MDLRDVQIPLDETTEQLLEDLLTAPHGGSEAYSWKQPEGRMRQEAAAWLQAFREYRALTDLEALPVEGWLLLDEARLVIRGLPR